MEYSPLAAFAGTSGPSSPRIVLVGEAWGESEELCRKPFAGESGKELWRMLGEAMPEVEPRLHAEISGEHRLELAWVRRREEWLEAAGIAMTNVLALRPPQNKLEALCLSKKELELEPHPASRRAAGLPALTKGKYLRPEFLPELARLREELLGWKPRLAIALGNTATWALLQATNIGSIRGATAWSGGVTGAGGATSEGEGEDRGLRTGAEARGAFGLKVLPTYHPAGVLRQWSWRTIVVADLMKAAREAGWPELRRPARRVLLDPTIEELEAWAYKQRGEGLLSPDIETAFGQITCIGFASSRREAIVIPFLDRRKPGWSYWPTEALESRAWACVEWLLKHPRVGQNFIYDLQYITRLGILPSGSHEDTMLLHHSLFPELQKGLGFLGSVYTDESSWKLLRKRKADTEKKDE